MTQLPSAVLQQRLVEYVQEGIEVSPSQRDAVLHRGRFFLNACPGSGKTRTVGVRVAYWAGTVDPALGRPRRIAATSYTNTAVNEIRRAARQSGMAVEEPSFAGTLHRFLIRYVTRPFGAAVMSSDRPPRLVADPGYPLLSRAQLDFKYGYTKGVVPAWRFEWRADGSLLLPDSELPYALRGKVDALTLSRDVQDQAREAKLAIARQGLMSMSDAVYWAMRALDNDEVAKTVASRFDELIVDEAQDTTDLQQVCLRRLVEGGLSSVVYVGDMEQAIYGFAHADVDGLRNLISATTEDELGLTENWRSSQAICDVAYRFSSRPDPDHAVGEFANASVPPELLLYPDGSEITAIEAFKCRLDALAIPHEEALVLCRWTATSDKLGGSAEVMLSGGLKRIVDAAVEARNGGAMRRETITRLEGLLISLMDSEIDLESLDVERRHRIRAAAIQVVESAPDFALDAKSWAAQARSVVSDVILALTGIAPNVGGQIRAPSGAGDLPIVEIIGAEPLTPAVRTIHSAKGESHLATLLLAVNNGRGDANWTTWLGRADPEESRVAYVALTRAQRYSALALPASCPDQIVDEFLGRGFQLPA